MNGANRAIVISHIFLTTASTLSHSASNLGTMTPRLTARSFRPSVQAPVDRGASARAGLRYNSYDCD